MVRVFRQYHTAQGQAPECRLALHCAATGVPMAGCLAGAASEEWAQLSMRTGMRIAIDVDGANGGVIPRAAPEVEAVGAGAR